MGLGRGKISLALLLLTSSFCVEIITAIDTITSTQFLRDPEAIVSNGSIYTLGFFSPVNSTDRYVGIWFNEVPVVTAIWVANRNKPLNDSSGILAISKDGNLVVLNGQQEILWSSNVSNFVSNSSAQLSDTGNLVLRDNNNEEIMWESFQHPSDTFFSNMKLSANKRTGEKILITSWKSATDPSIGSFSAGLNRLDIPEIFIWKDNYPYFRSGPWNRQVFIGVPYMNSAAVDGLNLVDDGEGTIDLTFSYANQSFLSSFVLTSQGQLEQTRWEHGMEDRIVLWSVPMFDCEFYARCGPFGSCNAQASPICSCLRGFEPNNPEEWYRGNWTSGCIRRKSLQCERVKSGSEAAGKNDVFLKLAYAYNSGIGCMSWIGDLIDVQEFPTGGADLYIRMAYSELDGNDRKKVIVIVSAVVGTITSAMICALLTWRFRSKHRARKEGGEKLPSDTNEKHPSFLDRDMTGDSMDHVKLQELPLFSLESLTAATDGFDLSNKLGQGGFGPVYKGKLSDGKEIAVKRLSRASGQGLKEFMNEVEVISKLQHRNLVRLLGCCVEGEEKLLVYEYMPNKSLDAFLYDPLRKQLLDWKKRFNIIEGICRGLLYLHRDSRLRIIHRDLKASNILLDPELKPKISDFGAARIFGGDEDQANTIRVVGTYGYISPEYAMEGRFSEKSDVYSFGVLLLEIVSGRRNTSFYGNEQALSLLGFAWKLWNEGNISALVDPAISDPSSQAEIFRCIHIGLLCVQEFPEDRPSASTVVSMLNSEISYLATPKQPPFAERKHHINEERLHQNEEKCSINYVTVTGVDAR
ncbi:G-type lectin S-receptor-like serine/threonine-protein kinase At1g11330 isoform X3 [Populus alba]|uniref:G-type lectin S-receptor-like serine/threonine-protein kinase At1g11330 isoform X3 n=1 Tax=Populus alba TaxID=43335 RepID=UPI003CC75EFD